MEKQKNYEELTISDYFMFGKICSKPENRKLILDALLQIEKSHKIIFNTTANLENLPTSLKNMLEYINTSVTTDRATEMLDIEVKKARLREEWKAEYMLTLVHDTDVFRDGFEEGAESRQPEIDALNHTVAKQTAEQKRLTALLISHGIDPNENKTNV